MNFIQGMSELSRTEVNKSLTPNKVTVPIPIKNSNNF